MLREPVKTIVFSTLRIARGLDNEADRHFLQINQTKQMASILKHSLHCVASDSRWLSSLLNNCDFIYNVLHHCENGLLIVVMLELLEFVKFDIRSKPQTINQNY